MTRVCAQPAAQAVPGACRKPPGVPLTAADVRAAPEWAALEAWARSRPGLVDCLYLLGSRMRGDHADDSDLDIAIVGGPWKWGALEGAPSVLGSARVGWIPLVRKQFDPPPRAMGIPWVLMGQGVRLWGRALPGTPSGYSGASLMNTEAAYHNLQHAVESLRYTAVAVATAVEQARDPHSIYSYPGGLAVSHDNAASQSSLAAEFACKAALALRGVEPRRSHSVDELCSTLAGSDPCDPLLASLRPLDGRTKKAHESIYFESTYSESLARSVDRAAGTMDAVAEIVTELERHRGDRPPSAVVPLGLRALQEGIEQVPEGGARGTLQSRFHDMEAAIMAAHLARPAPSR